MASTSGRRQHLALFGIAIAVSLLWFAAKIPDVYSHFIFSNFFLHSSGSDFLDTTRPSSQSSKIKDSPVLDRFNFKTIGVWSALPLSASAQLTSLDDFTIWLGLSDSRDHDLSFDLRVEVLKNGAVIASGQKSRIDDLESSASRAKEIEIDFGSITGGQFKRGDVLGLRILARISSYGYSKDTGRLRLYYDSASRPAGFAAKFPASNTPPVANAGPDQTVAVNDKVTLNGSNSSDGDGDELTFTWSFTARPAGSLAILSDPHAVKPTFRVDRPGIYTLRLVVNDGNANSEPDSVTISTRNSKPVANAGPNQTSMVGQTVTLDGSKSSDVDGDALTYRWSFVSKPKGSKAALQNPTGVNPKFVPDKVGDYVVQLIVNDGLLDSVADTVKVSTINTPPVANAGAAQTAEVGDTIVLNGGASSDVDGNLLTYAWTFLSKPDGSKATLKNPTRVNPSFVIDLPGNYVIQLIVNDGLVNSTPATVTISTLNSPPVAAAGPDQVVFVGDTVQLNGSGSADVDGNPLTFSWSIISKPQGSIAMLVNGTTVNPTFVVDVRGSYVVQLIVNDGTVNSTPDTVTIATQNRPPLANAGPDQSAPLQATVVLDGSASSDPDKDLLTFSWSILSKPAGSAATLSDPTAVKPTFSADRPGTYVGQLIVNDGQLNSAPDTVTVSTENSVPIANAGADQTVPAGSTVQLDGSLSNDPDGSPLFYFWSITTKPQNSNSTLSDPSVAKPTFVADTTGTYVVQLIVGDGLLVSAPDTVMITSENHAPVVNAGPDQTIAFPAQASLAGTVSDDGAPIPPGTTTKTWSKVSGQGTVTFGNVNAPNTTASFSQPDVYVLRLTANDGALSASDDVQITVNAGGPGNRPPVITSSPITTATVGQLYSYDVDATDPDVGNTLMFSLTTAPTGMSINTNSGLIQWTPAANQVGSNNVTVRVEDQGGQFATQSFTVQVGPPGSRPPFFTSAPSTTATVGQLYSYDADASDPDAGDTLTFSLDVAPSGMAINSSTGLIQWTPASGQVGGNSVTVRVQDQGGQSATQSFTIQVGPPPSLPPVITSNPSTTATVGRLYSYNVDATDPDAGDTVTFSLNGAPLGMTIDPNTGVISWTPAITQTGPQNVTAIASDGRGGIAAQTFSINVSAAQANRAPTAQDDQYAVRRGETLTVPAPGVLQNDSDPDGQSLTSVLVSNPTKGTLNFAADGSFNFTPAVPPPNSTEPVLKFTYSDTALFGGTLTQPIVIDLNKDGVPEILFISQGPFGTCKLIAVHGNDGSLAFSINGFQPTATPPIVLCDPFTELAAGDIDGDGFPEIIAVDAFDGSNPATDIFRRQLIAFNHDGTHKWTSEDILSKAVVGGGLITSTAGMRKPVIADLNGDGIPEIVVGHSGRMATSPGVADEDFVTAFDNQGQILWTVRGGGSGGDAGGTLTVQDIDLDGKPEIIFSDDVYDNQGNRLWSASPCLTCLSVRDLAVANLDDDPFGEIVYLDRFGQVYVYEHTGALKWGPLDVGDANSLNTVGDVDGDGKAEIVVTSRTNIVVIAGDGSSTRSIPVPLAALDGAGGNTTIFDLNGDGKPELIHNGFHSSFDTNVGQGNQQTGALYIFDGATGALLHSIRAVRGGGIYPEQGPVVADVNGDGSAEIVTGGWNGMPLLHVFEGKNGPWAKARPIYNQVHYSVTNVNSDGTIPAHPAINWLTPGLNNFRVNIPLPQERTGDKDQFTYKANDGSLDSNTATVRIDVLPPNHAPQILSQPPTVSSPNIEYLYGVLAFDADAGEILTFSLAQAPAGMTINPASGLVRWTPTGGQIGRQLVAVKVTDSVGEFAYQGYSIEVVGAVTVPNVVGQTQTSAQTILAGAGLTAGTIVTTASNTVPVGQVISQGIAAGTSVPAGAAVSLFISSGPQTATVPNVVGQTQAAAQSAINGVGLAIGTVTTAPSTTVAAGNIISQDPAGGTPVALGTSVNLIVSIGTISLTGLTSIVVEPATPTILVGQEQAFTATGVFNDGTSQNLTGIVGWSSTAPTVATISTVGVAKGLTDGSTTIQASANSITGSTTLTVRARIADGTLPNAAITAPTNNAEVTSPVDVVGNATDANFLKYRLEYAPAGETTFTLLNESSTPVSNGVLGKFDPTMLINDQYTIRLTVFDRGSNTQQASVNVQVARDMKIGLFTITFQDLNVAVSGLPITVNRTYDSRDKRKGDFGFGWRLNLQTLRVRANRVLGTGWVRGQSGAVINLTPTDAHKVSVTLPDGRIEEFDMQVSPTSGLGALDFTNVVGFTARPGTVGKLESLAENSLAILNAGPLDELVDINTLNTYNPQLYRYTTGEGTQIEIHVTEGVKKVTDLNGNTLTFGPNGITHSAGKGVIFARDAEGRITQITDPAGNIRTYAYDANGDLISATDQVGNIAGYKYNRRHGLIDIMDPAGNHAARNEYDADGRLIATIDANGNRVEFTHNLNASQEIVRDRLGNVTVFEYDAAGNVASKTDALSNRTTYTHDAQGNQLTETDPLGRTASKSYDSRRNVLTRRDFDGNTAAFTYNARNQVLTTVDPEGRVTTNVYDTNGNLMQITDPEGGVTRHTYDPSGNVLTTTDAVGNVIRRTYDAFGNKTSEIDPVGTLTTSTYDTLGNVLSTAKAGTQTTQYQYDSSQRLIKTTDALGRQTTQTYSQVADGSKIASLTDAKGQTIRYDYDARGSLTRTTYADGSTETLSYDSENRVLSKTDRDGRTISYVYDALGRKTKTTNPDGSFSTTTYDSTGRKSTETDERGSIFTYTYGPNKKTALKPLGHTTVTDFDSSQQAIRITDALGRTTQFRYDSAGNLVQVTFPDGTTRTASYDLAKRKTAETDQAGLTTQFTYDPARRLVSVTDAAGGVTSYSYDPFGNRLTQTDTNGHTTTMTYDLLGRLLTRTRPMGQRESFTYDVNGNQLTHTDFNGMTTTFVYDSNDRLVSKNLPGGRVVTYTYTLGGLRTRAGAETFIYDARNRLVSNQQSAGNTIAYSYDASGNRISMITPQGTTTYTYDVLNRLATVVDGTGTTGYTYDSVGNLSTTTFPNGLITTNSYDTLNRLTQVVNSGSNGVISSYSYLLGPIGNRVQVTESGTATTGRTVSYTYDSLYRLTREQIDEPGTTNDRRIDYNYDAVGNRLRKTIVTPATTIDTVYVYDNNDRLISETTATIP